ncbi:CheR family methyltransferase [Maridesulfovibrio zosterae]|uniref:CheR family methyltransferase n=1 Tax=Maridesulfovibrio zosterae TaxID=82171 RepID=UPI000423172F|nr:protein-glutamate O-methyltransferase CheR [Maridesulfovibrio zosterae]
MNLEPFYKILNKTIGLSPESMGRTGIKHALTLRMRETDCNENEYLSLLRSSDDERTELVEEIVVPETWFFRDTKPFELLFEKAAHHIYSEFRVLSAPCSTGEEAYSIAMTLMGAGLDTAKFKVHGVDISQRALQKARSGIFTENSFRSEIPVYAASYFQKCNTGRQLSEKVRKSVDFYAGNLIDGCLPSGQYDVIFCRNLLIYLDDQAKNCLIKLFCERLKNDGILFVGHAEMLSMFDDWFTPVRKQGVFAFKKGPRKLAALLKEQDCSKVSCNIKPDGKIEKFSFLKSTSESVLVKSESAHKVVADIKETAIVFANQVDAEDVRKPSVAEVKLLADKGRIDEALVMCNDLLAESGPDSQLLHLSGLLHEAKGQTSMAEKCYGKALYLEPNLVESLVHLSLLLENRGETRKAELLRNRVRRAENN